MLYLLIIVSNVIIDHQNNSLLWYSVLLHNLIGMTSVCLQCLKNYANYNV